MAFVQREITVIISLGSGNFGDAGQSNTVTLTGLRVSAQITKGAVPTFDWADVRIWGMTPSQMNAASRLGKPLTSIRNNVIQLYAGDAQSGMALVFSGTIQTAFQDFTDMPNACLNIGAQGGGQAAMAPIPPTTYAGPIQVATLLQQIAAQVTPSPLTLENNGVTATLTNPYFPGTATEQIAEIVDHANIYSLIDTTTNTLAIWPKNGSRNGAVPLISPSTGMVGPPRFNDYGLEVRALFNSSVQVGRNIQVQSDVVPQVNGLWRVMQLTYELESRVPGGAWFLDALANNPNTGS